MTSLALIPIGINEPFLAKVHFYDFKSCIDQSDVWMTAMATVSATQKSTIFSVKSVFMGRKDGYASLMSR